MTTFRRFKDAGTLFYNSEGSDGLSSSASKSRFLPRQSALGLSDCELAAYITSIRSLLQHHILHGLKRFRVSIVIGMITTIMLVLTVPVVVALWITQTRLRRAKLPYPPGPPAEPLLGHLRALPRTYDRGVYRRLADTYGMCGLFLRSLHHFRYTDADKDSSRGNCISPRPWQTYCNNQQ